MGKNKLAKFADLETYSHVFQYSATTLMNGETFPLKGKWREEFFNNSNPIVLELGCGKGEYTIGLAKMFPNKNFIGVDIKGARIWGGAKEAEEKQMKNVAFIRTNIELIHSFFAEQEVDEIWLTFPDPQMKKERKRLTSTNFIRLYQQFIKPDGIVHLKTDSNFMFTYTCELVKQNRYPIVFKTEDLYKSDFVSPILSIQTFYEQQWMERGLSIKYIQFVLEKRETLIEPDIEIERDPYRSFGRNQRSSKN